METKNKDHIIKLYDYMKEYSKWHSLIRKSERKTKINNLLTILGD